MDDALLSYYNRELAYLRHSGKEFADKHPKIAGRLRLDGDTIEDPHVSRLVESFAFLSARIREKLDDGFPELTDALLGVLYPQCQAPIPSLTVVKIKPLPDRPEIQRLHAGTVMATDASSLATCFYRSCFDTEALPVEVTDARFVPRPFQAPRHPQSGPASKAVLRIRLQCTAETRFEELTPGRLRFYLHGQPQTAFRLYEYLLRFASGVAIAAHPADPNAAVLPGERLQPCGLTAHEAALPSSDGRTSNGSRLVTEYFAFPEKFLFVELTGLEEAWSGLDHSAELFVYFDRTHPELVHGISATSLVLGCTPAVNLFEEQLENIPAGEIAHEHKLSVDVTQTRCAEIHSVRDLHARDASGRRIDLAPFYGNHAETEPTQRPIYWHTRRVASQWHSGRPSGGSDLYLSFMDGDSRISMPDGHWLIGGRALCTNRDVPEKLPFGPGEPRMRFSEGGAGLSVDCVTAPTPTLQRRLADASQWQLVTYLTLQHFTGERGLEHLSSALALHDVRGTAETRAVVDGLLGLRASLTTARITRDGRAAICQGTAIDLVVDETRYSGSGLYLFSAVLSEFLAQQCAMNTFVQLTVHIHNRPGSEIRWPPKSGTQTLI